VVLFWGFSTVLNGLFGPAFSSAFGRHREAGLLILVQCILWSAIALNDLVSTRALISGSVVLASIGYLMVALPIAWAFLSTGPVGLSAYVPIHSIVMAGYFTTQALTMWWHGVGLARTWMLTLVAFIALSLLTQVL
jgi:hypothetical protein